MDGRSGFREARPLRFQNDEGRLQYRLFRYFGPSNRLVPLLQ